MSYHLFLDDARKPSDVKWIELPLVNWTIVRNYKEFVETIIKNGIPTTISFDHDLSMADYEILAQLSDAPDRKLRMSELAAIALLSRSRLSHRMKVMEKAGWVKREACPSDKRGYFAVMTPKGWKAIVAAAPDHVASVRARFVNHLSKADQEVLAQIFSRIETSFNDFEIDCSNFCTSIEPSFIVIAVPPVNVMSFFAISPF